jgi:Na+/melibiose symporter-like transporter
VCASEGRKGLFYFFCLFAIIGMSLLASFFLGLRSRDVVSQRRRAQASLGQLIEHVGQRDFR